MVLPVLKETEKPCLVTITEGDLTWTYIERPGQREISQLAQNYPFFHPLNLEDCLSTIQRPKIDEYKDHLFLVFHFPIWVKQSNITKPSELDVFVGKDFLITVHCSGNLKPLTKLFQECQSNEELRHMHMGRGPGYLLYQIIDRLVDACFPMLDKINDKIQIIQDTAISKPVPQTAQAILLIRRDIISLRRIIRPQMEVMETLERKHYSFLEHLGDYFGDIADHLHKIWGAMEDQRETVDALADTSNWLTSHRTQEVMRVLTIIMGILMPVEVIASIEGSNLIPETWLHQPSFFIGGLVVQLAVLGGMILFMRRRHWI